MKNDILILSLLAVFLISTAADQQPADPKWPNTFQIDFTEELYLPALGTHKTNGKYSYDYPSGKYRIDRENGHYDRYCGLNGIKAFQNTPCSQIVNDGDRYIYYPEKSECCYCCSAEHGCGILKPDWMTGATYEGEVSYSDEFGYSSESTYKWDQKGLQDNFYYETENQDPEKRIVLQINQVPDDKQIFNSSSMKYSFDKSILEKPDICQKSKTCSWLSTCSAVRGTQKTETMNDE